MGGMTRFAFGIALALCAVAPWCTAAQPARTDSFACRETERRYEMIKSEVTSVQLNQTLFAAADKACEPLARALLAAGASLEARDRLGAMPLAHAAAAGSLALIDLFLEKGAAIDARNIAGSTEIGRAHV